MALTIWALTRGRTQDAAPTPVIRPAQLSLRWVSLGLIPAGAIVTYNALFAAGSENIPVADWIPPVLMFGGMVVFAMAILRTLKRPDAKQPLVS